MVTPPPGQLLVFSMAALGAIEYDRAWNAGSALSHDGAIAFALDSHVAEKELHVQFGTVEIS